MSLDLDTYKMFVEKARYTFEEDGEHIPMIFAFAESALFVIPLVHLLTDSVPRQLSYAILRHLLRSLNVDSYVLVSEAWKRAVILPDPIEGAPRVEILQIVGVFPDGKTTHTSMNIRNKKIIGESQVFDSEQAEVDGGLMNLVKGKPASPEIEIKAAEIAARLREQVMRN